MAMEGVSRYLSLTVAGSSTNASLGAVSGVVVEVTQSGAGPAPLVATQPAGRAGATTPSKFSVNAVLQGPPVAVGDGATVAVAVGVGGGVPVAVGVRRPFPPEFRSIRMENPAPHRERLPGYQRQARWPRRRWRGREGEFHASVRPAGPRRGVAAGSRAGEARAARGRGGRRAGQDRDRGRASRSRTGPSFARSSPASSPSAGTTSATSSTPPTADPVLRVINPAQLQVVASVPVADLARVVPGTPPRSASPARTTAQPARC